MQPPNSPPTKQPPMVMISLRYDLRRAPDGLDGVAHEMVVNPVQHVCPSSDADALVPVKPLRPLGLLMVGLSGAVLCLQVVAGP